MGGFLAGQCSIKNKSRNAAMIFVLLSVLTTLWLLEVASTSRKFRVWLRN